MANLPTVVWVTPVCIIGDRRELIRASSEPKKSKIRQRNSWIMANLPIVGCVTPVSIMWDVWDPLGLYLNQKVLKLDKERPSCGQFTNGRLRDSSEYPTGCMGSRRASFEPKISKIGQEMAELWPIYQREVAWLKWVSYGMYGIHEGFIWTKKI